MATDFELEYPIMTLTDASFPQNDPFYFWQVQLDGTFDVCSDIIGPEIGDFADLSSSPPECQYSGDSITYKNVIYDGDFVEIFSQTVTYDGEPIPPEPVTDLTSFMSGCVILEDEEICTYTGPAFDFLFIVLSLAVVALVVSSFAYLSWILTRSRN